MSQNKCRGTPSVFMDNLQVLFIGLKLGGVIEWSWIWVLSPIWIMLCFVACVLLVAIYLGQR